MRFECHAGCTKCCEQKGFVYLTEDDVARIAAFMNVPQSSFEERYVYRTKHLRRLRKPRGAQCPFLTAEGCSVHSAKPTQCRIFPFWPELIEGKQEWKGVADWCPGMRSGELVNIETARRQAEEMRAAYPHMY